VFPLTHLAFEKEKKTQLAIFSCGVFRSLFLGARSERHDV
jgi:hypothetical protein